MCKSATFWSASSSLHLACEQLACLYVPCLLAGCGVFTAWECWPRARGLVAIRMAWTDALALVLDAGIAIVIEDPARARDQLERAHAEFNALGMMMHAAMTRRRLGELIGGAKGQEAITAADSWLAAQGVVSPERLARIFMPEVA